METQTIKKIIEMMESTTKDCMRPQLKAVQIEKNKDIVGNLTLSATDGYKVTFREITDPSLYDQMNADKKYILVSQKESLKGIFKTNKKNFLADLNGYQPFNDKSDFPSLKQFENVKNSGKAKIRVNVQYLMDVAKSLGVNDLTLEIGNPTEPIICNGRSLVMPMRLP